MQLTSIKTIRELQEKFDFAFKKGLGQNFLTNPYVLEKMVECAEIEDGVLEIGPGFGVLTYELAKKAPKVVALEIDERLPEVLAYTLSEFDNVKVINTDALKADIASLIKNEFGDKKISIAANLPYYITTPIITKLLESHLPIKAITVMVQKEVAERLSAKEGSKAYGAISVLCAYYCKSEIVVKVPSGDFVPAPKVDSAVLKLTVCDTPNVKVNNEALFFKVVKAAFSQRRKTLLNCMSSFFHMEKNVLEPVLDRAGIDPKRRGETLSLEEFATLCNCTAESGELRAKS